MNFRTRTRQFTAAIAIAFGVVAVPVVAADPPGVPTQSAIINQELSKAWTENKLKPSKKASDYEFCRRVFIDLVGRIPSAEEVRDFAENDSSPTKRAKLVHRLMYDKDYKLRNAPGTPSMDYATEHARHMSNIWGVWLMTRGGVAEVYHDSLDLWLEEHFLKNTPWNEVVRQLLTATGKTTENGAVAFMMAHLGEGVPAADHKAEGKFDMVPLTARVSRLFLGIQTNCIQCHDHPFNTDWKQDNFWGLNAFFRQIDRDGTPALKEGGNNKKKMTALPITLKDNTELNQKGLIFFERRSLVTTATKANFLPHLAELDKTGTGPRRPIPSGATKSRREHLADYVLAHDNFSKAYVNRIWSHFFGRGMNELPAADDFGGHNKVVHENLLNTLASEFVKYEFDSKKLMEWICNSDAYSLTYQANGLKDGAGGNAKDDVAPYFSRMALKSMSPEVLFESLEVATRLDSAPDKDAKKTKRDAWMNQLVRNFGDDEGNETTFNGTIIQALLMMNGPELNSEISRKDGTSAVEKAMNKFKAGSNGYNDMAVINELYLMALGRKPSAQATIYFPQKDPKTGKDLVDPKGQPIMTGPISEMQFLSNQLASFKKTNPNPAKYRGFFEDVFWSLLNTSEFILNH